MLELVFAKVEMSDGGKADASQVVVGTFANFRFDAEPCGRRS